MENLANREWCSQLWNLLLYLESAYQFLDQEDSTIVNQHVGWGVGMDNDELEAQISFKAKPADQNRYNIWIGLWMIQNGPRKDCPIWVQLLTDEEDIWEKLKNEFIEPGLIIDEDKSAVGLPWLLSQDASNEDVKAAGEKLANHIINVLTKISPDDMNNN